MAKKRKQQRGKVLLIAACVAVFVVAAYCFLRSPAESDKVVATAPLFNTQWQVIDLSGQRPAKESLFVLVFDETGKVSGKSGCNGFSASYKIEGQMLEVSGPLVATKMACPQPVMHQEKAFLKIIGEGEQVVLEPDGRLFVWGDHGRSIIFQPKA